jgi:hypothetical protein
VTIDFLFSINFSLRFINVEVRKILSLLAKLLIECRLFNSLSNIFITRMQLKQSRLRLFFSFCVVTTTPQLQIRSYFMTHTLEPNELEPFIKDFNFYYT